ncbi:hypothetical protein B7P43_G05946 [Cryptotermes secundus]|uniref:Uncharacterized protein n=1 Tax=Cryptotermes secundus TaxID=105785 RepID=A0A2J7PUM1_9NEOP|nr:hypothetical protein B7P43_G05946 [Cryptotermes secundus]
MDLRIETIKTKGRKRLLDAFQLLASVDIEALRRADHPPKESYRKSELKRKLTPYHSKPPHLFGLPKIHKPDIPLRPIVSSIGSPCYALAGFLQEIRSLLAGRSGSFVKNSGHFIELLKSVNLRRKDKLACFDVVSLFTNVPVDEALQVIRSRLNNHNTLAERSVLKVEAIMELLDVCLRTTYFQRDDGFYQQKNGMALLATSTWNILKNWLLTRRRANRRCGSDMWTTHCDLAAWWGTWLSAVSFYRENFNEVKEVVAKLEDEYACVREAKVVFGYDTVSQDVNFIHAHFSTVSKAIESLESCGALLHDSLEVVQKVTCSMNSAPGEIEETIKCKLEIELNSNPGLKEIQSVSQYLSEISVSLPNECSELSAPVYKYCSITSVGVERSFSAYKLILTDNNGSLSPENIERLRVACCDATFCSE